MNQEIGIDIYTLQVLYIKQITGENRLYSRELSALWRPKWEGNPKKEGIHAQAQLIHLGLQQKLMQLCKASIYQ